MKTQELEDKLHNVEIPVIEIEGHRNRLKMELLNSDYFNKKRLNVFITHLRKYLIKDSKIKLENVHNRGFILKIEDDN